MSLEDLKLELSAKQAVTGTSADSTNVIDFGKDDNKISGNVHGAGYLNIQCCADITPAGAKASGTVTLSAVPDADDTLAIAGTTAKFVAADPAEGEILIGADVAKTIENIIAFNFGTSVKLSVKEAGVISVEATAAGTAGNSITMAKSSDGITLSGATLSGGVATNTVTVKLKDSSDGVDYTDVPGCSVVFADAKAGDRACLRVFPVLKRFVKVSYGATSSLTAGKWDAYIGAPIAEH